MIIIFSTWKTSSTYNLKVETYVYLLYKLLAWQLSASGDSGVPEVVADPQGEIARTFQDLGVCVVQQCAKIRQQGIFIFFFNDLMVDFNPFMNGWHSWDHVSDDTETRMYFNKIMGLRHFLFLFHCSVNSSHLW